MTPDDFDNQLPEPWLTKQQLAENLAVSDRWIELQQHVGLPYLRMGWLNRYRVSESRHGYASATTHRPRAAEQRPGLRRTRYIANELTFAPVRLYEHPFRLSSGILNLTGR